MCNNIHNNVICIHNYNLIANEQQYYLNFIMTNDKRQTIRVCTFQTNWTNICLVWEMFRSGHKQLIMIYECLFFICQELFSRIERRTYYTSFLKLKKKCTFIVKVDRYLQFYNLVGQSIKIVFILLPIFFFLYVGNSVVFNCLIFAVLTYFTDVYLIQPVHKMWCGVFINNLKLNKSTKMWVKIICFKKKKN